MSPSSTVSITGSGSSTLSYIASQNSAVNALSKFALFGISLGTIIGLIGLLFIVWIVKTRLSCRLTIQRRDDP